MGGPLIQERILKATLSAGKGAEAFWDMWYAPKADLAIETLLHVTKADSLQALPAVISGLGQQDVGGMVRSVGSLFGGGEGAGDSGLSPWDLAALFDDSGLVDHARHVYEEAMGAYDIGIRAGGEAWTPALLRSYTGLRWTVAPVNASANPDNLMPPALLAAGTAVATATEGLPGRDIYDVWADVVETGQVKREHIQKLSVTADRLAAIWLLSRELSTRNAPDQSKARSKGWDRRSGPAMGGPPRPAGQWTRVNESLFPRARGYQAHVTGRSGQAYVVRGVRFDGVSSEALLEAKGPGYARFVKNGEFPPWFRGRGQLVSQAKRQIVAANGFPIEWHVAERETAAAIKSLLRKQRIPGIRVVHTPPPR